MATVGSFGVDLGLNTARFDAGVKRARSSASTFASEFKSGLGGLATAAGAAVLGITAVAAATKRAVDAASAINDAAKAAGIGAETYQAWGYAAKLAGVNSEEFAAGLTRANKVVGDAARGNAGALKTLQGLRIAYKDTHDQVLPVEEVIKQLADRMKAMGSDAERASAAAAFFGKSAGPKMAELLSQGSAGLAAAAAEAKAMGAVLSDDLVARADEAGDRLDALDQVVRAQLTAGLIELTPVLTSVGNAFAAATPYVTAFFEHLSSGSELAAIQRLSQAKDLVDSLQGSLEGTRGVNRILGAPKAGSAEHSILTRELEIAQNKLAKARAALDRITKLRSQGTFRAPEALGDAPTGTPAKGPKGRTSDQLLADDVEAMRAKYEREDFRRSIAHDSMRGAEDIRTFIKSSGDAINEELRTTDWSGFLENVKQATTDWQNDIAAQAETAATRVTDGFERVLFAGFRDGVQGMKDEFKNLLVEIGLEFARSKLKEALTGVFTSILGGSSGGGGAGFFGSLLGAVGSSGKSGQSGGLKKLASGGTFQIQGSGTSDNQLTQFVGSPGELVTVTPRGQSMSGGGFTYVQNIDARGADPGSEIRLRAAADGARRAAVADILNLLSRHRA